LAPERPPVRLASRSKAGQLTLLVADIAAIVIVVVSTAVVVVGVLGLFVWAAIQDGRDEAARARDESQQ
jgi:hypothetical protein